MISRGLLSSKQKIFFSAGLLLVFYALFDGLLSYLLPLQITALGFSIAEMGLIISSSNIFGAIFDFVLAKYLPNTHYRRLFLIIYGLCFVYPLFLMSSKSLPLFLVSMSIWGLYSDLHNFALFDFVSRRSSESEHAESFSILGIFKSVGYLIAPIIAGLVATQFINYFPYFLSLVFIAISFIFYLILIRVSPKKDSPEYDHTPRHLKYNFIKEFKVLKVVGKTLFPVLLFSTMLYIFDGAIWTIAPLYSQSFEGFQDFGGLFMSAYTLPVLLTSWFINPISHRFGKKRTAYLAFIFGCLLIIPLGFVTSPHIVILLFFVSSCITSIAWPAIRGAFADYISESSRYSREIESLNDFTCNIGFILGPALSGIIAEIVGLSHLFTVLGLGSVAITLYLLFITPRSIRVSVPNY